MKLGLGLSLTGMQRRRAAQIITEVFQLVQIVNWPLIVGAPVVGYTLRADPAPAYNTDGDPATWRWLRDGSPISGATGQTYTLVTADLGAEIEVEQTVNGIGGPVTKKSYAPTDPIAAEGSARWSVFKVNPSVESSVSSALAGYGDFTEARGGFWASDTLYYQYVRGGAGQGMYEFTCPTPKSLAGATVTNFFSNGFNAHGIWRNAAGTRWYMSGRGNIITYVFGTPGDISTLTQENLLDTGPLFDLTRNHGIWVKPDETQIFVDNRFDPKVGVFRLALSIPGDITTASMAQEWLFDLDFLEGGIRGIAVDPTGTRVFLHFTGTTKTTFEVEVSDAWTLNSPKIRAMHRAPSNAYGMTINEDGDRITFADDNAAGTIRNHEVIPEVGDYPDIPENFVFKITVADGQEVRYRFTGQHSVTVDWGDGSATDSYSGASPTGSGNAAIHTYTTAGTYDVTVSGDLIQIFRADNSASGQAIVEIVSWGKLAMRGVDLEDSRNLTNIPANEGYALHQINMGNAPILNTTAPPEFYDYVQPMAPIPMGLAVEDRAQVNQFYGSFRGKNFSAGTLSLLPAFRRTAGARFSFQQTVIGANIFPRGFPGIRLLDIRGAVSPLTAIGDIAQWDIASATLASSALPIMATADYDATLNSWAAQGAPAITYDFGDNTYSAAGAAARAAIIAGGATITDGGEV